MFGGPKRSIGFKSTTGWERSHFGGFNRIINDYPYIKTSDDLNIDPSSDADLSHYQSSKLLKMFILCAKEYGGLEAMFVGGKEMPWFKMKYVSGAGRVPVPARKLITTPDSMRRALNLVLKREKELAPLFNEYEDFIVNSVLELVLEVPPEEGKGEGEGEGEGDGEGKSALESALAKCAGSCPGEGKPGEGDGKGEGEGHILSDEELEALKEHAEGLAKGLSKEDVEALKNELEGTLGATEKSTGYGGMGTKYSGAGSSLAAKWKGKTKFIQVQANAMPAKITPGQIKNAEMLLKMLDISWESDKDTVKSLRMGKIDIAKIAEVPAGNVAIYQREMEEMSTRPFSICVLMDESGSMGQYYAGYDTDDEVSTRYGEMYKLIKSLYYAFNQLVPDDKIFVYGHSGGSSPEIYTYHDRFNPKFMYTIDDMKRRRTRENYDGPVIEAVHKRVREMTDDRIIFLVLSDGAPCGSGYGGINDVAELKRIVEKARRDEFVTVGIGIQYSAMDLYTYSTVVDNIEDMPKKVSHILNKVVKTEFQ